MISLHEPLFAGNERKYIKNCLDQGWVSSAGKYVDIFEKKIEKYTGAKYAIACINGTSALQISLKLVGVIKGDEVIVPSMTFIAPVNAINYKCPGKILSAAVLRKKLTSKLNRVEIAVDVGNHLHFPCFLIYFFDPFFVVDFFWSDPISPRFF